MQIARFGSGGFSSLGVQENLKIFALWRSPDFGIKTLSPGRASNYFLKHKVRKHDLGGNTQEIALSHKL